MQLPVMFYGASVLRKKSKSITKITNEIKQLILDMVETMDVNKGLGIAAPQVNKSIRLFVVRFYHKDDNGQYALSKNPTVFINSKILEHSDKNIIMEEGCLSLPGLSAEVERPTWVKAEYTDENGNIQVKEFIGYHARVFLHEHDHLNGVLYIDRIEKSKRKELEPHLLNIKKQYAS